MKLNELIKGKRIKAVLGAALVAVTAMTPMQALAYTSEQADELNNQMKVKQTLEFKKFQSVRVTRNGFLFFIAGEGAYQMEGERTFQ